MNLSSITTFVFDLGGVLMDWDPRYHYSKITDDVEKIEYFLENICTSEWNSQMDAGKPFKEAIAERSRLFPEWKEWISDWHLQWPNMLKGTIPGTYEVLKKIKDHPKSYKLLALSNWSQETFPIAQQRHPELEIFEDILISGKEKLIKPDPAFFRLLCKKYDVQPYHCLFIDDLEKNILAAAQLGFHVHHFKNAKALEDAIGFDII